MVIRKRLEFIGPEVVFITTTVKDWIPLFSLETPALTIINELNNTLCLYPVSVMAYVLMPSHFHTIFHFEKVEQLSKFMQCLKSISARRIKDLNIDSFQNKFLAANRFQLAVF